MSQDSHLESCQESEGQVPGGCVIGWTWQPGDVIKLMHMLFADDGTPMVACETEEQLVEAFVEEYSRFFEHMLSK